MNASRFALVLSSIAGATGVGCGAFGAHALRPRLLELGRLETWQTAVHYHLVHALALLALAALARANANRAVAWTAALWAIGIVLFSGSLYWLAVGGPRWLGPVTPLGGVAFLAGWLSLLAVNRTSPAPTK